MTPTPELLLLKEELVSLQKELDKAINDGKTSEELKPIMSRAKLINSLIDGMIKRADQGTQITNPK